MTDPATIELPECDVNVERCHGDILRRVTESDYYILNGERTPYPFRTRVSYECAECGRKLAVDTNQEIR